MPDDKIMAIPQELLILGAAVKTGMIDALRKNTTYTKVWLQFHSTNIKPV